MAGQPRGVGSWFIRATLSAPSGRAITLGYVLIAGTASWRDANLQPGGGMIPAGATTVSLAVGIFPDPFVEDDEQFTLEVSAEAEQVTIADGTAVGTIPNDDHYSYEPLTAAASVIHAADLAEIRQQIDALRVQRGLAVYGWQTAAPAAGGVVRVEPVVEARAALAEVYVSAGASAPSYGVPLTRAQTVIGVAHVEELRTFLRQVPPGRAQ